MKSFASDNYAGVHPEIMEALAKVNHAHAASYGRDEYTERAVETFKIFFGKNIEVFFVYNGTSANVLGLSALARSYNSILCAETAHINVDESTAPENFTGCKLVSIPSKNGKITAHDAAQNIRRVGDQHHPQARVISISQCTEYGTVYSVEEIKELSEVAKKNNLFLHMDGSRIANAAVNLGKSFREFTSEAGVDVLSFGGTKNGLMFGEAIIFFKPELAANFNFVRKQGMQLNSKMRFIAAQFEALLSNNLWQRNATHTNRLAHLLEQKLRQIPQVQVTQKVEGNGVFVIMPTLVAQALQNEFPFYSWNDQTSEMRLMCSWDTTEAEVNGFITKLKDLLAF